MTAPDTKAMNMKTMTVNVAATAGFVCQKLMSNSNKKIDLQVFNKDGSNRLIEGLNGRAIGHGA